MHRLSVMKRFLTPEDSDGVAIWADVGGGYRAEYLFVEISSGSGDQAHNPSHEVQYGIPTSLTVGDPELASTLMSAQLVGDLTLVASAYVIVSNYRE